ncbi:MAG TPA: hypothetical protein PK079_00255 [Leptospiraceae bacterium]|nr:hypothetical protein [Leptospiraceae bacterium]HMW05181.1 hypothetical protein [Leptospiraceae bacterium]HMX32526.1 hypothetical protein [Leptospiraceae bacterium]HMY32520.1 hypothetical protein [Leptospiraceae bacterium]HMZ63459.1 hypothetical protein [Leptospiraceae bacterium]
MKAVLTLIIAIYSGILLSPKISLNKESLDLNSSNFIASNSDDEYDDEEGSEEEQENEEIEENA